LKTVIKQRDELDETIQELNHLLEQARAHSAASGWDEGGISD